MMKRAISIRSHQSASAVVTMRGGGAPPVSQMQRRWASTGSTTPSPSSSSSSATAAGAAKKKAFQNKQRMAANKQQKKHPAFNPTRAEWEESPTQSNKPWYKRLSIPTPGQQSFCAMCGSGAVAFYLIFIYEPKGTQVAHAASKPVDVIADEIRQGVFAPQTSDPVYRCNAAAEEDVNNNTSHYDRKLAQLFSGRDYAPSWQAIQDAILRPLVSASESAKRDGGRFPTTVGIFAPDGTGKSVMLTHMPEEVTASLNGVDLSGEKAEPSVLDDAPANNKNKEKATKKEPALPPPFIHLTYDPNLEVADPNKGLVFQLCECLGLDPTNKKEITQVFAELRKPGSAAGGGLFGSKKRGHAPVLLIDCLKSHTAAPQSVGNNAVFFDDDNDENEEKLEGGEAGAIKGGEDQQKPAQLTDDDRNANLFDEDDAAPEWKPKSSWLTRFQTEARELSLLHQVAVVYASSDVAALVKREATLKDDEQVYILSELSIETSLRYLHRWYPSSNLQDLNHAVRATKRTFPELRKINPESQPKPADLADEVIKPFQDHCKGNGWRVAAILGAREHMRRPELSDQCLSTSIVGDLVQGGVLYPAHKGRYKQDTFGQEKFTMTHDVFRAAIEERGEEDVARNAPLYYLSGMIIITYCAVGLVFGPL